MKRILSIFFCVILLFSSFNLKTYASTGSFELRANGFHYSDDSALPSGHHFYFKYADGKAWYTTDSNYIIQVANRQGLVINPDRVSGTISSVIGKIAERLGLGGTEYYYVRDSNDNILGYAVNDISGCALTNLHGGTGGSFGVTSEQSNLIHSALADEVQSQSPDFISIGTFPENLIKPLVNAYYTTGTYSDFHDSVINYIENPSHAFNFYAYYFNTDQKVRCDSYLLGGGSRESFISFDLNTTFVCKYGSNFDAVCSFFDLTQEKNVVSIQDLQANSWSYNGYPLEVYCYDSSTYNAAQAYQVSFHDTDSNFSNNTTSIPSDMSVFNANCLCFSNIGWITVYKDINIIQAINNNTYAPTYRVSNTFVNYSPSSSSNSYNISYDTNSTYDIDNSTNNNTSIYNQSNTEINNNTTQNNNTYNIDNSTTIIDNHVENIYNIVNPSPSPDPGGGGGGDDPIWQALLQAIASFFTKVGEFLGAVLTGILGLLSSILDSLSEITTDFGGLTDFISGFFSVLPTEIVVPITTGITLMVVICLLKALK